jgi:hypothetical protein
VSDPGSVVTKGVQEIKRPIGGWLVSLAVRDPHRNRKIRLNRGVSQLDLSSAVYRILRVGNCTVAVP